MKEKAAAETSKSSESWFHRTPESVARGEGGFKIWKFVGFAEHLLAIRCFLWQIDEQRWVRFGNFTVTMKASFFHADFFHAAVVIGVTPAECHILFVSGGGEGYFFTKFSSRSYCGLVRMNRKGLQQETMIGPIKISCSIQENRVDKLSAFCHLSTKEWSCHFDERPRRNPNWSPGRVFIKTVSVNLENQHCPCHGQEMLKRRGRTLQKGKMSQTAANRS